MFLICFFIIILFLQLNISVYNFFCSFYLDAKRTKKSRLHKKAYSSHFYTKQNKLLSVKQYFVFNA